MRLVWILPFLVAACGDDGSGGAPGGTYAVSWKLAATGATPTCDSHKLTDVIVSATDTTSNNTVMVSTTCSANNVMLEAPIGTHRIKLEAIGQFDEVAGVFETNGAILTASSTVTLPEVMLPVLPPTSKTSPKITLQKLGQPTTCSASNSTGITIITQPMTGSPTTDIFDCGPGPFMLDVAYGPYSVQAELLGSGDAVIGRSPIVMAPAARGVSMPDVIVTVN